MKTVYVAGSYSSPDVIEVFNNMRRGMEMSYRVLASGFAPFCPWLDFHFKLLDGLNVLKLQDFYDYSLAWLEKSDMLLVLPNSGSSVGTQAEIKRAKELNIPIYYSLEDLIYAEPVKCHI